MKCHQLTMFTICLSSMLFVSCHEFANSFLAISAKRNDYYRNIVYYVK